jgi:hypothetical protein
MAQTLEELLDLALDTRQQRLIQGGAEQTHARQAIGNAQAGLERKQTEFRTRVHSLINESVEKANRHLARRPEHCEFREVSGYFTGPLYAGGSACNPIAYELRVDDKNVGETLLIELTRDGMIEASLGPLPPSVPEAHTARIEFGWRPIPLDEFDAVQASDLVVRYISTLTGRRPVHR